MALIQNFGLFIVFCVISMLNISAFLQIVVIKFFLDYHALFQFFEADPVSPPA
jgi:hypothetical protein